MPKNKSSRGWREWTRPKAFAQVAPVVFVGITALVKVTGLSFSEPAHPNCTHELSAAVSLFQRTKLSPALREDDPVEMACNVNGYIDRLHPSVGVPQPLPSHNS